MTIPEEMITYTVPCEACKGNGIIADTVENYKVSIVDCPVCNGKGYVNEEPEFHDTERPII